jgi:hypothetical protein
MSKIYLYKMTVDDGGAPCVCDRTLSLAICKPAIRTSAHPGDYILGFAGNSLYEKNCLVYAAKVGRCPPGQEYYTNRYKRRPDCVYEYIDGFFKWRVDAKFHGIDHLSHDLGEPPSYPRARVLLVENSSDFRYFRDSYPKDYQSKYGELAAFIQGMTQGHRTNLDENLRNDVRSLLSEVWATPQTMKNSCVPSTRSSNKCGQDEGEAECDC